MKHGKKTLVAFSVALLAGCGGGGGGGGSSSEVSPGAAANAYPTQSGVTEPLYKFQWALKSAGSYFSVFPAVSDGRTDINVESVHLAGIKGQGVNVLVIDDGVEMQHEDLVANTDASLSWNFRNDSSDPTPSDSDDSHGTAISGIIAAAQNEIGVMGIAPRAKLGGVTDSDLVGNIARIYGGAEWSKRADVFNFSMGENPAIPETFDDDRPENLAIHAQLPALRGGKGAVMLKSAGNEYERFNTRECPEIEGSRIVSCDTAASDPLSLELPVLNVAAANARGVRASYSSAGALNWITGLGGESDARGDFGEQSSFFSEEEGPQIFSTDLSGCNKGKSRTFSTAEAASKTGFVRAGSAVNLSYNPKCNYAHLNGTSASTPVVTGVVALMLSANPKLGWRDVRDILRETARKIDPDYGNKGKRNQQVNLAKNTFVNPVNTGRSLVHGSPSARLDFGWQKNAAGHEFSTWYGFGLVDAAAAVERARTYTAYQPATLTLPAFAAVPVSQPVVYGQVTEVGKFTVRDNKQVDALQLRLSSPAADLCLGSVGIYVKSPGDTVSALWVPYNIYYNTSHRLTKNHHFGVGSYAFYGESAAGEWTIYAVSGKPRGVCSMATSASISIDYRIIPRP